MKVLILSNLYPNQLNEIRGGFVRSQVVSLTQLGCLLKVVSPVPLAPFPIGVFMRKWKDFHKVPARLVDEGIEVCHPRYLLLPRNLLLRYAGWTYYQGTRKLVDRLHWDWGFGLIHAHTAYPDGYAAMLFSRMYQIPFIVTIHGRDLQDTVQRNAACAKAVLEVLRSAAAVINVSHKLSGLCRSYVGESSKITVVGNGIEPSDLFTGPSPLQKTYGGQKIILSVGSLRKTKGHDLTLHALKALMPEFGNIRLLLIGGGEERKNLQALAKELEIADFVEFIPPQPHHKVMEYMSISDLFVLPSWSEGFGIVYLEAMAHGKPVIGVKGEGIEDFVASGVNGLLVEPFDVEGLAGAMAAVLNDPVFAGRLGDNARQTVLENYTWQDSARRVRDIYSS
ncbi:MAG: glycosyltransferase family 4 protein, partial [Desulfotomaculaceae bacterium]|nr:glycosyltransferase family 4 protein [Desulfotomaculaceae bacterium]